jgi:hypothetical protein
MIRDKMKVRLLAGVCAVSLLIAAERPAKADLPVIDIANLAQAIKSWTTDINIWINSNFALEIQGLQWLKQQAQYLLQLQQYANEIQMFINWVHDPTLGGAMALLSFAGLGSGLPVNPLALLGVINGIDGIAHDKSGRFIFGQVAGVLSSMSAFVNIAYLKNHVYTLVDGSWDSQQVNAAGASIAGIQGLAMQANQDLQTHLAAQPALRDHLLGASSPKDVQDATAEVDLETTWELNEIGQLNAAQVTYMGQQDSRQQRDIEAVSMSIDNWLAASGTGLQ